MANERQSKYGRVKAFTTFEDIIALALARSKRQNFSASTEPWCKAMLELKKRYSDLIPELKDIYFSERPPLTPQSDQVYQIFTTLARAGEMSLPNPQFEKIVINNIHKTRIRKVIGDSLSKYDSLIDEIVPILEEGVAIQ